MGQISSYKCSSCGYSAEVEGGEGCGFIGVVQTVYCSNCRNLFDMEIGTRQKVWYKPGMRLNCNRCRDGQLLPWNETDPCPKCGGVVNNEGEEAHWD